MFTITGPESALGAAAVTSLGYIWLGHRQKQYGDKTIESHDTLTDMQVDIKDLKDALLSHTADDARNFHELRAAVGVRRRRGWILPALGILLKLMR